MSTIVQNYLDLLDSQRENTFAALDGLTEDQIWQRPAAREWCLGEILDHNYLLIASTLPYVKFAWATQKGLAYRRRNRQFSIEIQDPYHQPGFPMWVGFLWNPRYSPRRRVKMDRLISDARGLHAKVRDFYQDKEVDLLGNTFVYDPLFGLLNLIVTLRIGIYHDQLHQNDLIKISSDLKVQNGMHS